jgi:mono/diheme cytochrome c family protein
VQAAANPAASSVPTGGAAGTTIPLAESLGIHFVPGSSSQMLLERDGKTYVVDLAEQTIQAKDSPSVPKVETAAYLEPAHSAPQDGDLGSKIYSEKCADCHGAGEKGGGSMKAPDLTSPVVQAALPDALLTKIIRDGKPGTAMPAWSGKLSDAEIDAVSAFVKSLGPAKNKNSEHGVPQVAESQSATIYEPADDYLFSLPTGRRLDRHGLYLNFTHRFAYTSAFSGPGGGNTLLGLDDFAIASFGLRFGVTDKLSVAAYRSPSIIGRPIELMVAYNLLDEHDHQPVNFAVRASVDGQDNFSKNFTSNLEFIMSRSVTRHAQFYVAPTVSFQNRELIQKPGQLAATPLNLPGFNTFSLGIGGAVDIRPTVALVAEVFPTLVNGREMGIHRPAFAFGIQKRVRHHAFTLGFSTSPGTIVSQRAGTRATLLGNPSADTPSGLFIGFDLMRQIY